MVNCLQMGFLQSHVNIKTQVASSWSPSWSPFNWPGVFANALVAALAADFLVAAAVSGPPVLLENGGGLISITGLQVECLQKKG